MHIFRNLIIGELQEISVIKMNSRIWSLIVAMVLGMSTFAASVETDRNWYLAGEAMKVRMTADDAMIAYAELCDTRGLAAGVMVSLNRGEGTGIIELPSNLHSGYYVLSVYTRDNANVYQRLVAVVNPLRKSVDDDIEWVQIASPDSLSYPESEDSSPNLQSFNSSIFQSFNSSARPKAVCYQRDARILNAREIEGHIINARVKNVYEGKTFRDSDIRPSMSIVGKQIHYFEGEMVNDSIAVFYTYGIHGRLPIVLSAISSTGESLPIEVISPFAALLPKELPHLVFHYQRSEVEARSLAMQRHQMAIAHTNDMTEGGENMAVGVPLDYDDTAFSTKPDLSYNLDEYRQFLTIREVLLEYVICVEKKKVNGVQKLLVRIEPDHYDNILPSLVLIDGMPVFDIERLLNYDARRIHYINIYGGQYTFGHDIYNGILSFVTRSGQLTNYPIERNMQYLVYDFPE